MEKRVIHQLLLRASELGNRLYRNNTGKLWSGKSTRISRNGTYTLRTGDVIIHDAKPLAYGLCVGSPDTVGWHRVEITQEMVGKTVCIFCTVEIKTGTTRVSQEQKQFLHMAREAGAIAFVARNITDYERGLREWEDQLRGTGSVSIGEVSGSGS